MIFEPTPLPGCWHIRYDLRGDARGCFVKTMHEEPFRQHGLAIDFREQYYSHSQANVVRGMHFQRPPHDHEKLVTCLAGSLFDVVLDLRVGSPTFGQSATFRLEAASPSGLYIPRGCAHGFCALEDTLMLYNVTSVYQPDADAGVLWHSIDAGWPVGTGHAVVSPRDAGFSALKDFVSPFLFP